jgi:hypothetical protein
MSAYDFFYYIFSVEPDSYTPMKNNTIIHFIFCLAMFIFMVENFTIMCTQALLNKVDNKLPFSLLPVSQIAQILHSGFLITTFPSHFLVLFKPFSVILYTILYVLLITYGFFRTFINMILKHFTGNTLNI